MRSSGTGSFAQFLGYEEPLRKSESVVPLERSSSSTATGIVWLSKAYLVRDAEIKI